MNFSEFKRRLGAEPRSRDPELLAARDQGPEYAAAADEAAAFETRLEDALRLPVDAEALLGDVLNAPRRNLRPRVYALAASLLAIAGVTAILWTSQRVPSTLPDYLAAHYEHDGYLFLERIGDTGQGDIERVLARFGVTATPALSERIGYIKVCPSMSGEGAHMVVRSGDGWVTVLYLPGVEIEEGRVISVATDLQARMLAMAGGAAAVIGADTATDDQLAALLHASLLPVVNDA